MGSKRDYDDAIAAEEEDGELTYHSSNKRRREQQSSKTKQSGSRPDPTYGQRVAFPGLDDDGEPAQPSDDDLEFEENGDALAYLRAVRQEASGVPHVLVAPRAGPELPAHLQTPDDLDRSIYDSGVGDTRGYYHDGAYTAAPSPTPSISSTDEQEHQQQDSTLPLNRDRIAHTNAALRRAYYASLTSRFLALRALLHQPPPPHLLAVLPADHGTHVGAFGPRSRTFRTWTRRLRHTDPLPAQVAALDQHGGGALRVLRVLLGGKFLRRGTALRERTSRWLWALLARLPDRGEMDYAEVGWVRELGKRAVLMMVSMAQAEALREEVGVGENEDGEEGGEEGGEEWDVEEGEELGEEVVDLVEEEEGVGGGVDVLGGGQGDASEARCAHAETEGQLPATTAVADDNGEEGELDMDIDEGEVSDDDGPATAAGNKDIEADIAAAKARLLARLEAAPETHQEEPAAFHADEYQKTVDEDEAAAVFDEERARLNTRATLNMILTVAGEFYGQRDLLEFRDPFPAV